MVNTIFYNQRNSMIEKILFFYDGMLRYRTVTTLIFDNIISHVYQNDTLISMIGARFLISHYTSDRRFKNSHIA